MQFAQCSSKMLQMEDKKRTMCFLCCSPSMPLSSAMKFASHVVTILCQLSSLSERFTSQSNTIIVSAMVPPLAPPVPPRSHSNWPGHSLWKQKRSEQLPEKRSQSSQSSQSPHSSMLLDVFRGAWTCLYAFGGLWAFLDAWLSTRNMTLVWSLCRDEAREARGED